MKKNQLLALIFFVAACQFAGILGSVFTFASIENWYIGLTKPFFSPPNWIFGPVWTTLYFLMGVSAYLVWNTKSKFKNRALKLFWVQLALNSLWSIIFFGLRSPFFALVEIIILWYAIVLTIKAFEKVDKTAGYLLLPYILWVTFAMLLNLAIVYLNY